MIKNIHFVDNGNGTYDVQSWKDSDGYDWDKFGTLEYNSSRGVWTLWFPGYDDGVDYFSDLSETMETIRQEFLLD